MGGFGLIDSGCGPCKLSKSCKTPNMPPSGEGRKGILIIAEAPGATEDEKGIQLVGDAGKLLRRILADFDIDLDKDCRKINSINCRPPKNRTPTTKEIAACRPKVWEEIRSFKPKLLLLLGNIAIESFLDHRWKKEFGGVTKWRGFVAPDREANCWSMATYHPSYLLRSQGQPVIETIFRQDIETALTYLNRPFPRFEDEGESIKLLRSEEEAIVELKDLYNSLIAFPGLMAFDYETTGLKPYNADHDIVCCAVATKDRAFAFEMSKHRELRLWWKRILTSERIKKTAHNAKFEDTWTNIILGHPVNGWEWCSMQAAHIMDNRPGISGLKFQAYINYGIMDYSSEIEPYLKTVGDSSNGFNRVREAPLRDLLKYCGMDALIQYWLAERQRKELLW